MAETTRISWAHSTFNPWVGCERVSAACDNCYAESWARRTGHPELWNGERRRTTAEYWRGPLKWNEKAVASGQPWRVFCASLADVFDDAVPEEWRTDLWNLIRATPHLTWMLLTKRPQNIQGMLPGGFCSTGWGSGLPNVWLGTTAEDAEHYRLRAAHLAAIPCRLRFLSYEPALGPIGDLDLGRVGAPEWIICGGESGPGARPMHPDWARSLRDQCTRSGTAFFFKQWGGRTPKSGGSLLDGREHKEFPDA